MIGKIIGVWSNFCAHLSIGKEGPFVHISACIAHKLGKLSFFKDINNATKKNFLAAAVGAGVTATFGTPIGGVLFSIEVTSSYYIVANLWRTFFCSVFTMIVYCFFQLVGKFELFGALHLNDVEVDLQYFLYIILGLICGMIGSLFIICLSKLIYIWTWMNLPLVSNWWIYCITVALISATITFPLDYF